MLSRAGHLEVATFLNTEACLATFDRFIARRGLPTCIYTDKDKKNFVVLPEKNSTSIWYGKLCAYLGYTVPLIFPYFFIFLSMYIFIISLLHTHMYI